MTQCRHHGGTFKARVAIEAIAGHKTVNEIASAYEIHPSQVAKWKAKTPTDSQVEARLCQEIGRLTMEVEYLKKKLGLCHSSSVGD